MATEIIDTNQTTTYTIDPDDDVLLVRNRIVSASGTGFFGSHDDEMHLTIQGTAYAGGTAINLGDTPEDTSPLSVTIADTGFVQSINSYGIAINRSGADIVNDGSIVSKLPGIFINGSSEDPNIVNRGTIAAQDEGIYVAGGTVASVATIYNSGTINATRPGQGQGILVFSYDLELTNTGEIDGFRGIFVADLASLDSAVTLVNSGTISGSYRAIQVSVGADDITNSATGLLAGDVWTSSGNDLLRNHGEITGDVSMGVDADVVFNKGVIDGGLDLGGGADTLWGFGGTVLGQIDGGSEDDVFYLDQTGVQIDGGTGEDTLYLRADPGSIANLEWIYMQGDAGLDLTDDDTATYIRGNSGANAIDGADGNDTLLGQLGDDALTGGAGDDQLIGNTGDDELDGGGGSDILFGGRGFDELTGGAEADELYGGTGADTLSGGTGKDTLAGGEGADVFLFETAADAGAGSDADIINGFVRGEDVIDLIALGNTPASFIGTAGFSGTGTMEVRYTVNAFGNALVRIDEDGNGTEDARIVVSQTAILEASDFLL